MGESSPDKIYGREFARQNIWARVRQIECMGEGLPEAIWVSVRQINIWMIVRQT